MQGFLAVAIGERSDPRQHRYVVPLSFACYFLLSTLLVIVNCLLTAFHCSASIACTAQHGTAKAVLLTASAARSASKRVGQVQCCLKESKGEQKATQQRGA